MAYQITHRRTHLDIPNRALDFHINATGSNLMEPSHSFRAFLFMRKSPQAHRPEIVHNYLAYILRGVGEKGVMIDS